MYMLEKHASAGATEKNKTLGEKKSSISQVLDKTVLHVVQAVEVQGLPVRGQEGSLLRTKHENFLGKW